MCRVNSKLNIAVEPKPVVVGAIAAGVMFGLASAIGYTISNAFLKSVSHLDPVFVSAVKCIPTLMVCAPWLLWRRMHGMKIGLDSSFLWKIIAASTLAQIAGNVAFQWALGVIGMAMCVPLTMGTIILSGAMLGALFLGERVGLLNSISMILLIIAISVLSFGTGEASRSVAGTDTSVQFWKLAAAFACVMSAGLSYGILGVALRFGLKGSGSAPTLMMVVGMVGIVILTPWTLSTVSYDTLLATSNSDLWKMAGAGIGNIFAFVALTKALQLTTLLHVNLLNASQVAMAAVAGIGLFGEAVSIPLVVGVLLTIGGLTLMRPVTPQPAVANRN
ncbi:MAG: DME family drug/metabolite transporter [Pirellulaceae bacterium]|jgi:DME family drug/metabolite transporter